MANSMLCLKQLKKYKHKNTRVSKVQGTKDGRKKKMKFKIYKGGDKKKKKRKLHEGNANKHTINMHIQNFTYDDDTM